MRIYLQICFLLFSITLVTAQTKVGGRVVDEDGKPISYANVIFPNSIEGTITNENGSFYMESDEKYDQLEISFLGYATQNIPLTSRVTYDIKITLVAEAEAMDEVVLYSGKTSKKNNPAIDILKKIWANRRSNGLKSFKQYQYDKYEKVEFDLNSIDSTLINKGIFNGLEFIFDHMDTSNITGKTFLPMFINESSSKVYGDNELDLKHEEILGNRNSGFSTNQAIIAFIKEMYHDFDVYDNYLKFFDKSFTSPLSKTGVDVYNYMLLDSAYIDKKWCYNIIYYPRRSNELTFKGDFWVNDTTWAIKEINLRVNQSANVNWVKEIYIEQEFDLLNDSIFLLKKDYFLSEFALNKREKSKGLYGHRTTFFDNYSFDKKLPEDFYNERLEDYDESIYKRDSLFWNEKRQVPLSENEKGVYVMLDSLQKVPKYKRLHDLGVVFFSGFYEWDKMNLDIGPVYSLFGYNDVEGLRLRLGGRTYFNQNDPWRIEGFGAYGFKDQKFKFGLSGKVLVSKKNRFIVEGGYRKDVEQIGASLTTSTDVLGRNLGSSSLVSVGNNDQLTKIELANFALSLEPAKNFVLRTDFSYRTLESASPNFNLDYYVDASRTEKSSLVEQVEARLSAVYEPGKHVSGYGVERNVSNEWFPNLYLGLTTGLDGFTDNDFEYYKIQGSYRQPWRIGGVGIFMSTIEAGKTIGEVPLGLLSIIPGNQNRFSSYGTFSLLNYYEFVSDTYVSLHLKHNFGGRLFARLPLLRKLNLREIIGFRAAWGQISDENRLLNATGTPYLAPDETPYYEYSLGVGNIFKILRIDFNFRGNYLDLPDARKFGVTGVLGFSF